MTDATQDLHRKYRPAEFDEMRGQDAAVNMLLDYEDKGNWPHSYLFVGGAGCGKTTTARIIARKVGAAESDITEVDAAMVSSVDQMRALLNGTRYKGFTGAAKKVYIVDEVHRLSKAAAEALLKTLEEPPAHVYFVLCTTEMDKVLKTIRSRCLTVNFKEVGMDDLQDLLEEVTDKEGIELPKGALRLIAKAAEGSPRMALTSMAKCRNCEDIEEVRELLELPGESSDVIELSRMMVSRNGFTWKKVVTLLKNCEDMPAESIRLQVVGYVQKALLNTETEEKAMPLLAILDAFSKPMLSTSEKFAPILLAVGEILFDFDEE